MSSSDNKSKTNNDGYWLQMDELYAAEEKKNLLRAINKSDTEKFYQFTSMMRISKTLSKVKIPKKK